MINPNESGLIYYGTAFEYIEELDRVGLDKPRHRNEQFISVCVSGYTGMIKCEHPDLQELSRVFSKELKIASMNKGHLSYKPGYENSMTFQQGFGPNPNKYCHTFYGLNDNTRTDSTLTAVLSQEANKHLIIPSKEREFEYLSLALHSFIEKIDPDLILGWIVPHFKVNEVKSAMQDGKLRIREVWSERFFKDFHYDEYKIQRYGCFPFDIKMYAQGISKQEWTKALRISHLKRIIGKLVEIDWDTDFEEYLLSWVDRNADKIKWNSEEFIYESICDAIL